MMAVFDALPRKVRDHYNSYPAHIEYMKKVQIAEYFDEPYAHFLSDQIEYDLQIHENLFHVTVSRRPHIHRGESYHLTLTDTGVAILRNPRTA